MSNNTVESLKKEIENLHSKLEKSRLSARDRQLILDTIAEKKRLIEEVSKTEKIIVPIVNAPTIGDRSSGKNLRASMFIGNDRVIL